MSSTLSGIGGCLTVTRGSGRGRPVRADGKACVGGAAHASVRATTGTLASIPPVSSHGAPMGETEDGATACAAADTRSYSRRPSRAEAKPSAPPASGSPTSSPLAAAGSSGKEGPLHATADAALITSEGSSGGSGGSGGAKRWENPGGGGRAIAGASGAAPLLSVWRAGALAAVWSIRGAAPSPPVAATSVNVLSASGRSARRRAASSGASEHISRITSSPPQGTPARRDDSRAPSATPASGRGRDRAASSNSARKATRTDAQRGGSERPASGGGGTGAAARHETEASGSGRGVRQERGPTGVGVRAVAARACVRESGTRVSPKACGWVT